MALEYVSELALPPLPANALPDGANINVVCVKFTFVLNGRCKFEIVKLSFCSMVSIATFSETKLNKDDSLGGDTFVRCFSISIVSTCLRALLSLGIICGLTVGFSGIDSVAVAVMFGDGFVWLDDGVDDGGNSDGGADCSCSANCTYTHIYNNC